MAIDDEYDRLAAAYDPAVRLATCPDPDATTLRQIRVDFAIDVEMTQDQQGRLIQLIDEITDSPWNMPAEGVHWIAGVGCKVNWSKVDAALLDIEPDPDAPMTGEPTYDDDVFHVETVARPFVSDRERSRKVERRADRKRPPKPTRDRVVEALEAVAEFWGKDPEAFGDAATVTSLAGRFARVADKCRKVLVLVREAELREEHDDR